MSQALAIKTPEYTGEIVDDGLMEVLQLPEAERKIHLDLNFLNILARKHQNLRAAYFLDFLHLAQLTGADPRRKEIYLVTRMSGQKDASGQWVNEEVGTPVFAYQFFLSRAKATGRLKSWEYSSAPENYFDPITGEERRVLVSTARVWTLDQEGPITYKARWPEFVQSKKDGTPMQNWGRAPHLMLEKCALANAIRLAFPEIMSGMYTAEEIDPHAQAEPIKVIAAAPEPAPEPEEVETPFGEPVAQPVSLAPAEPVASQESPAEVEIFTGTDDQDIQLGKFLTAADIAQEHWYRIGAALINKPFDKPNIKAAIKTAQRQAIAEGKRALVDRLREDRAAKVPGAGRKATRDNPKDGDFELGRATDGGAVHPV